MKRLLSFILFLAMVFSLVSCAKNEGVNQPIDPPVSEDMVVTDVPETSATTETTTAETTAEETTTEATTTAATTTEATTTTPETTTEVTTTTEATTTLEVISVSKEMYIKREASVREAPDEDAKRIAKLKKGDKVSVSEIVGGAWYLVTSGDITGYVKSGYLSNDFVFATEATTTAATTVTTASTSDEEEPKYGPDDKLIALSFDDGPSLGSTNALLDYFEEMGIVGTFFVIGNNINSNTAKVMQRAHEMGCEIGNHTKSHEAMGDKTPSDMKKEISYVQDAVKKYIGEEPVLFRPPFINVSDAMYENIDLTFICGRDSKDWTGISAEERAKNVLGFADDGVIVLMHDGWDNYETVEAVKMIVPELLEQGYKFVTISELFEAKGVTIDHNKMYSEVK